MAIRKTELGDSFELDNIRQQSRIQANAASIKIPCMNGKYLAALASRFPERCPRCNRDCNFNLWIGNPYKEEQIPPIPFNHVIGEPEFIECMNCGWIEEITVHELW